MAESVKLDIGGSTDAAQRAIDQLTKKVAQLTEAQRKMVASSQAGSKASVRDLDSWAAGMERLHKQQDKWAQGLKNISDANAKLRREPLFKMHADSVGMLVGKVTALGATVGAVYRNWQEQMERVKAANHDLANSLTKPLAETAQLHRRPEFEELAGKLQKEGIPKEHTFEALGGVLGRGENMLKPELQKGLAGEAAKFGRAGMDTGRLGGLMADIAKGSGGQLTPQDTADMAILMRQQLGERAEQIGSEGWQKRLLQLREGGMSGQQALDYAMHGLQREEKKGSALALLDKKFEPGKAGHMTADERREFRRTFDPTAMKATEQLTERARLSDLSEAQLAAAPGETVSATVAKLKQEIAGEKVGPGARALANVNQARRDAQLAQGTLSGRWAASVDPILQGIDTVPRFLGLETSASQAQTYAKSGVKQGLFTQGEANMLLAELKQQTSIMKIEANRKPINIDQHTE